MTDEAWLDPGCSCCERWKWVSSAIAQEARRMEAIALQAILERDEARAQLEELLSPAVPPAPEPQP